MRDRRRPLPAVRYRRDGWTTERQIGFLAELASSGSVTQAAASVGMSRESAYRLRARATRGLFAALWAGALTPDVDDESHNRELGEGLLARLLGNIFRRQNNGFGVTTRPVRLHRPDDRTRPL